MKLKLMSSHMRLYVWFFIKKKGSPSARSSRLRRVRGRVRPLGSFVRSLSLHFYKRLFPGLEPVTSWSQGSSFTTAPRLPFNKIPYMYHFMYNRNILRRKPSLTLSCYTTKPSWILHKVDNSIWQNITLMNSFVPKLFEQHIIYTPQIIC